MRRKRRNHDQVIHCPLNKLETFINQKIESIKRIFLLTIAMVSGIMLSAQTQIQQGYVKTEGRIVDGKLVSGQGLKGATVSIKGRTEQEDK